MFRSSKNFREGLENQRNIALLTKISEILEVIQKFQEKIQLIKNLVCVLGTLETHVNRERPKWR